MGRRSNAGVRCPDCQRVLIPTGEHTYPPHFQEPVRRRVWCQRTNQRLKQSTLPSSRRRPNVVSL